jgi:Subtilase family
MGLQSSGKLMVRLPTTPFLTMATMAFSRDQSRYFFGDGISEPLFTGAYQRAATLGMGGNLSPNTNWVLHEPPSITESNPWDQAHALVAQAVARSPNLFGQLFAEPDLLHPPIFTNRVSDENLMQVVLTFGVGGPTLSSTQLNAAYPPFEGAVFGPGWHLDENHANFIEAWQITRGAGVRIAHLDTGCTPTHAGAPQNLLMSEGADYVDPGNPCLIDQPSSLPWDNPGHGTGTQGLLAGNHVSLQYKAGGPIYNGYLGGAPEAAIIPVRIGSSVVHLYGSTMARGLMHALYPTGGAPPCDLVSLSHGGLPSASWAAAVNELYDHGIVVVAASGDSFYAVVMDMATHYTVYPSAFYRVVTATGVTYDGGPYKKSAVGVMQGCWGPIQIMKKAIGAYTPNVPWLTYHHPGSWNNTDWEIDGGGTSASTPQIAAACALWLSKHMADYPRDWRRVAACRHALFLSASNLGKDLDYIGVGTLNAGAMLDQALADRILQEYRSNSGVFQRPIERDAVSFPFFRLLFGLPPPGNGVDEMHELEALQLLYVTQNKTFVQAVEAYDADPAGYALSGAQRKDLCDQFISDPNMSRTLKAYLMAQYGRIA